MYKQCNLIDTICKHCKCNFKAMPCSIRKGHGKYCSRSCSYWDHLGITEDPRTRFNKFMGPRLDNGCIEWTGNRIRFGYGAMAMNGKQRKAHRIAWEFVHGPIPKGMIIRHMCDNPSCVNVEHLMIGTYKDNSGDAVRKGRQAKGEKIAISKLTKDKVINIRSEFTGKRGDKVALARKYGVTDTLIGLVVRRKIWKHV